MTGLLGVVRLALSAAVTAVALDPGYSAPNAFTVIFPRLAGASPQQYMSSSSSE